MGLKCKAMIAILIIFLALKGHPVAIIKDPLLLGASFIANVGRMSVLSIGQMIILNDKSAEF